VDIGTLGEADAFHAPPGAPNIENELRSASNRLNVAGYTRRMRSMLSVWLLGGAVLLAAGCGPDSATAPPGNVLLVTLDTLRPDRLACYGNPRVTTPTLDRLAREGTLFENAYSPIPSTLPSHCSIMTGAYPGHHGVHDNGVYFLEDEAVTLAERLREAGHATAAFVAAFVLDAQFNLAQGFDTYDDEMDLPLRRESEVPEGLDEGRRRWFVQAASSYQRRGEAVTERALEWLSENTDEPFFLWVHYFDTHQPYQAPEPFSTLYDPDYDGTMDGDAITWWHGFNRLQGRAIKAVEPERSELETRINRDHAHMVARYDGEVSYLDAQLGRLLGGIQELDRLGNTFVVVVGDHGESFGEHRVQLWEHNATVFDEVLRVPMLLRRPDGVGAGERVAGLVRTIDVAPTLLDWLGLPGLEGVQGRSLLALTEDPEADAPGEILIEALRNRQLRPVQQSYLGLRTERHKVVLELDAAGDVTNRRIYDLATDPGERRPDAEIEAPETRDTLAQRVLDAHAALERGRNLPTRGLDEVDSEALRALGYLDE
jgi:arylsulfatase A-like enzyme